MATMISPVLIGRMALSHIGARSRIESLTENSTEAKELNLWFDFARKQTLEAFDWNFARKRITLALHGDDPPEDVWEFRYQYPSDAIRIRRIENPRIPVRSTGFFGKSFDELTGLQFDAVPFDIETAPDGTKSILSNLEEARAVYTFNQEATELFSELFVEAFSRVLASRIAFALTAKASVADTQLRIFFALMNIAMASNANEQVEPPPRDAEWIRKR